MGIRDPSSQHHLLFSSPSFSSLPSFLFLSTLKHLLNMPATQVVLSVSTQNLPIGKALQLSRCLGTVQMTAPQESWPGAFSPPLFSSKTALNPNPMAKPDAVVILLKWWGSS